MKVLKYLGAALVIIVVLFFGMGLLKKTIKYGHTITVNKPLREAWTVSQDDSRTKQWIDGLKSEELIHGTKGKVGSKYKVIVNPGEGQDDFEMIETVVSKKDFDHIEMHFDSDMMDFDQRISFSEAEGKTTIKTASTVEAKGLVMRSMFGWMEVLGGSFQKQEEHNINNLKKLIEENTINYYPFSK